MSSPPETPRNSDPQSESEYRFNQNGMPCEWGESYLPGGYHPVHVDDLSIIGIVSFVNLVTALSLRFGWPWTYGLSCIITYLNAFFSSTNPKPTWFDSSSCYVALKILVAKSYRQ